jgi:hypothetical protein
MPTIPGFVLPRDRAIRHMRGHGGFPVGQVLSAAVEPQAQRAAHRAADRAAGGRLMGEGIGAVTVVVVAVDVVKATS